MRALFALVVWDVIPPAVAVADEPVAVGLGHLTDFRFLENPTTYGIARVLLAAALLAYTAGLAMAVALLPVCLMLVAVGTINASFGATTHSTQIVTLCALAQAAWFGWAAVSGHRRSWLRCDAATEQGGAFAGAQAVVATYVISAISKIVGEGNWLADATRHFQIQATKNLRMKYYNSLSEQTAERGRGVQGWLHSMAEPALNWVEHLFLSSPMWRGVLLGGGFALELGAFIALAGRRASAAIGTGLILFHLTVFEIMGLRFRYNIYMLLIFLVGIPFWFGRAYGVGSRWLQRSRSPDSEGS